VQNLVRKRKMIVLPGLVKQLFWPSWKEDAESDMIMQISNDCQEIMNKQEEYLENWRCLGGNLLVVILISIFGSYVCTCEIIRSVGNVLQSVE